MIREADFDYNALVRSNVVFLLVSLLVTGLYLSFAIWAWGSWHQFFHHPARAALILVSLIMVTLSGFAGSSGFSTGYCEMQQNRWIFAPLAIVAFGLGWLAPYTDGHDLWVFGGDAMRYSGLVLFTSGITLRILSMFKLRHRFSVLVTIQEDHQLVTDGLYQIVRHPCYTGVLLGMIGWALLFRSLPGLLLSLFVLFPLIARMDAEEKLLQATFGTDYTAYQRRTWRLIPFIY